MAGPMDSKRQAAEKRRTGAGGRDLRPVHQIIFQRTVTDGDGDVPTRDGGPNDDGVATRGDERDEETQLVAVVAGRRLALDSATALLSEYCERDDRGVSSGVKAT
ncbi:hypothetical protein PHYPSEUDO_009784 [Phytophthora pseudosyringae]|uniref:Uncharacterized protein n=1 Tax=Phytophthora pseudosyringae TaxID=221518 RepID=A0A8T1VGQ9_9STRA|nr:hypothetical protein PHYPSEUDO_009784 [Phytophthora pseudosyringae]